MHKRAEYVHRHFEHTAAAGLRLFEREPFDHLVIGGLPEALPRFEEHLHRYLRDRIVDRWEIDIRTPTPLVLGRAQRTEQQVLTRQAQTVWENIQDARGQRGAMGPEEVGAASWARRVQTLLAEPNVSRLAYRCTACSRLTTFAGACPECGGPTEQVPDLFEEAVREAIGQSARVRYLADPALHQVGSMAALRRF